MQPIVDLLPRLWDLGVVIAMPVEVDQNYIHMQCIKHRRSARLQCANSDVAKPDPLSLLMHTLTMTAALQLGTQARAAPLTLRVVRAAQNKDFGDVGVEGQTEQALKNMGEILKEAGLGYDDVVKTVILLADIGDFAAVNTVYGTLPRTDLG